MSPEPNLSIEATESPPSSTEQLALLQDTSIEEDREYYLISREWWDKLKDHLNGFSKTQTPGPINNSPIFENGDLKDSLMERIDYLMVNEDQWNKLVSWYGSATQPIKRRSYKSSFYATVEVYPPKITVDFGDKKEIFQVSKFSKVKDLMDMICNKFEVTNDQNLRLIIDDDVVTDFEKKIDQVLGYKKSATLQQKDSTGEFPEIKKVFYGSNYDSMMTYGPSANSASTSSSSPSSSYFSSSYGSSSYSSYGSYSSQPIATGAVGLSNLGNTCFMNSSLQCLSNTVELSEFFLSGNYLKEINRDNPLGMKGEIADNFGGLIKEIWNSKYSSVSPRDLKYTIGQFAPQFSGYAQHDSQELLAFLLDGLHEDLNRITKKPYIESKDLVGTDEEMAKEAWDNHKKRNDSIIVDLFQGQFRSRVRCPNCPKVSNTFDPFMYLSLPLPIAATKEIKITMKYYDVDRKPMQLKIKVHKRASIPSIIQDISKIVDIEPEKLTLCEIWQSGVRHFGSYQTASSIDEKDEIYCFENGMTDKNDDEKMFSHANIFVVLCVDTNKYNLEKFGVPLRLTVPRKATYDQVYEQIKFFLKPYTQDITELENAMEPEGNNEGSNEKKYLFKIRKNYYDKDIETSHTFEFALDSQIYIVWTEQNKEKAFKEPDFIQHESLSVVDEDEALNLKSCLEIFRREEKLGENDKWYCPSCKDHQEAFKKVDLWSLPEVLVIHFKRFSYSSYYRDKIDNFIDFPVKDLDMTQYVSGPKDPSKPLIYDLYAISNHYGGMGGGHYTAYAKNKTTDEWFCFDDSSVSKTSEESIKTNAAYVLFYKRRNLDQKDVEMKDQD